ncbi:hypothetical protein NUACC21_49600 [Scytonema sp. NUACC21]
MIPREKYIVPIVPFVVAAIAVSLSSCSSGPNSQNLDTTTPAAGTNNNIETHATSTPTPTPTTTLEPFQPRAKFPATESFLNTSPRQNKTSSDKTTNVTLYTSDSQCQELVPQKVSVPAEEPVEGAVGKIIEERDSADFMLSGYRVNVQDGVATVDLRISPGSQRQFTSLSSCEQFALFGSLRKTLLSNSQWKIREVRFTERGEELIL